LDVDGVVCDLVGGVLRYYNRKLPKTRGDEAYDLSELLGYPCGNDMFWRHFGYKFWSQLEKTVEADEIVDLACRWVGRSNVCFLTHPCDAEGCIAGKLEWLDMYYPDIHCMLSCGEVRKEFCASPHSVLIDDKSENVDVFIKEGGNAFLFGRPWNRDWQLEDSNMLRLSAFLEGFSN